MVRRAGFRAVDFRLAVDFRFAVLRFAVAFFAGLRLAVFFAGFLFAVLRVVALANVLLLSMLSRESAHAHSKSNARVNNALMQFWFAIDSDVGWQIANIDRVLR